MHAVGEEMVHLQAGQPLVVEHDDKVVAVLVDEHVGRDVVRLRAGKARAGHGVELLDGVEVVLELVEGELELARQGLVAALFQVFQVLAHQGPHDRVVDAQHVHLHQQALLRAARGNAQRVEPLDAPDHGFDLLVRALAELGNLVHVRLEVAQAVEVADDRLADGHLPGGEVRELHLPGDVPFQGGLGGQPRLEGEPLVGNLDLAELRLLAGGGKFAEVVFPVRVAHELGVRGLLRIARLGGLGARVVRLLGERRILLLKERIFQEFRLHGLDEFEAGKSEKLDGLAQLGRHDQALAQLQLLSEFKTHGGVVLPPCSLPIQGPHPGRENREREHEVDGLAVLIRLYHATAWVRIQQKAFNSLE
jgi:hypothetical protein